MENPQHVIIVLVDTTRRDSFGCYGATRPVTPRMDAIAAEGVRFDNAIAQSSWTLPTVTTILTGTYPSIHGAEGKFTGEANTSFHRSRDEIAHGPELLSGHGFKTHGIVNAGFLDPVLGIERGFMVYDYFPSYNWRVRRADKSVDAALEFFQKNQRKNTFTFLHLFDPHLNYDPPGEFREMFSKGYTGPFRTLTGPQIQKLIAEKWTPEVEGRNYLRGEYDAEILFMDREIGRLVDGLRALALYDRTMLIIVADHGEEFWDHGGFEHGHTMYEELIRVALIVKLPSRYEPVRSVVLARVCQVDIMPTVFDVLGLEPPATFDGESLLPVMIDEATPKDRPAYSEGTLYGVDKVAFYQNRYKYILDLGGGDGELYDVIDDPLETDNLAASQPDIALRMRAALEAFRSKLQDRMAQLSPARRVDMQAEQNRQLKDQLEALGYLR
ncbi:MAG: sulfatase [Phycisphaerales bacterium]|nr:MAG: sulfatase [Phycisphaerales bacterium]